MMPAQARWNQFWQERMAHASTADEKRKFQQGLEQFNRGEFFASHETWEEIWLKVPQHEKPFLQGIIQVAAAFHHFQRSNYEGCASLLAEGLRKLEGYSATHGGLALEPLRSSVRWWLRELCEARCPTAEDFPRLAHADPGVSG